MGGEGRRIEGTRGKGKGMEGRGEGERPYTPCRKFLATPLYYSGLLAYVSLLVRLVFIKLQRWR